MQKRLPNPVIKTNIDYTPKGQKKDEEIKLTFKPCCVCKKEITAGYYARWGDGGVCSKTCDSVRQDMFLYLKDLP